MDYVKNLCTHVQTKLARKEGKERDQFEYSVYLNILRVRPVLFLKDYSTIFRNSNQHMETIDFYQDQNTQYRQSVTYNLSLIHI